MEIDGLIKEYLQEEKDLTKKLKNLILECIRSEFLSPEKLQVNVEYDIWSLYPGCDLTFKGIDEILKIEKEVHSYYYLNDCIGYNIYGKNGIIVRSGITNLKLREQLLDSFKKTNINSIIVKEIIDYLYSGKTVSTYDHINWEEAKKGG